MRRRRVAEDVAEKTRRECHCRFVSRGPTRVRQSHKEWLSGPRQRSSVDRVAASRIGFEHLRFEIESMYFPSILRIRGGLQVGGRALVPVLLGHELFPSRLDGRIVLSPDGGEGNVELLPVIGPGIENLGLLVDGVVGPGTVDQRPLVLEVLSQLSGHGQIADLVERLVS